MDKRKIPCLIVAAAIALTAVVTPSLAQINRGAARPAAPANARNDSTPIRPIIPGENRNDPNRVFLEKADSLIARRNVDYQILVGNVHFRRGGMNMYCDSAHFYDMSGSFDAFGNVKMRQGDTLFIDGDELNYNDSLQLATIYADYGKKVSLKNRDVTLTTDIFNYDLASELGYYDVGGVLTDKQNKLTSLEGEYNPSTKEAVFTNNVVLNSLSETDTLTIHTNHLYYNTDTHVAELTTESTITNADGVIVTTEGIYNTETTEAELYDRSTVTANNGNTLTGDTLFYNRKTGIGYGFGNIEINDYGNKSILYGDYGFYNELTDSAIVTRRARAVDYSQGDSIHLHGDTIRGFRVILPPDTIYPNPSAPAAAVFDSISPDSLIDYAIATLAGLPSLPQLPPAAPDSSKPATDLAPIISGPDTIRYVIAAPSVRFFKKDIQGVCDSMTISSRDSILYMNYFPVVWSDNRQITGDLIQIHFRDSTADWAKIPTNSFMAEEIEEGYYNQLSGKEMIARFIDGHLDHLDVNGNVLAITFPEEEDSTINKVTNLESSFLAADFKDNTIKRMKLWSETNATVTPLYLARKSIFFLQAFKWYQQYRPSSPDEIFEFPDALLDLFNQARRAAGATLPKRESDIPAPASVATNPEEEAAEDSAVERPSDADSPDSANNEENPDNSNNSDTEDEKPSDTKPNQLSE